MTASHAKAVGRVVRRAVLATAVLVVLSTMLPLAVLADDCSDTTPAELSSCAGYALGNTIGFFAAAAIAIAGAMAGALAAAQARMQKVGSKGLAGPRNLGYDQSWDYAAAETRFPQREGTESWRKKD